ncbi:host attachment protein [Thiohalobacter sp. IOR34]|uniref:host attachment protein n=1 Tax=Thiohalobacter sp. IOR34 TaxID=3057176 RepID=UPI0025B27FF2|nr:host attachment protein [Thiohalobacter sp. IOR34]WJW76629.1 host attachment protein [Thiohalobacter sp. IOR34]
MTRTMVLVAEGSRAKLYLAEAKAAPLREIADFVNPEGRLHEGDLVSDDPGRDGGGGGFGPHVLDEEVPATEEVQIVFARQLAERLEEERLKDSFDELVLVAAPHFLGLLRNKLTPELAQRVVEEIDKDLVRMPADELRAEISVLL